MFFSSSFSGRLGHSASAYSSIRNQPCQLHLWHFCSLCRPSNRATPLHQRFQRRFCQRRKCPHTRSVDKRRTQTHTSIHHLDQASTRHQSDCSWSGKRARDARDEVRVTVYVTDAFLVAARNPQRQSGASEETCDCESRCECTSGG